VLKALEPETPPPSPKPRASKKPLISPAPAALPSTDRARGFNYQALALAGVGVAGATVGTIMGLKYQSNNDDAKAICPTSYNCTAEQISEHTRLVKDARKERVWMYVGAGVGVAGLAGAAFFWLVDKPRRAHSVSFRAVPAVGQGEVGASVVGSF
jgi:hypothetical protein